MAVSDISVGLGNLAQSIKVQRGSITSAQSQVADAVSELNGMTTTYATLVADIGAIPGDTTDAYLLSAKAQFNALVAEYTALLTAAQQVTAVDFSNT